MSEEFIQKFLLSFFENELSAIHINADPIDFDSIILSENDNKEIVINDEEENFFQGYKYCVKCGASKIVFIFEDFNEVIKIPFNGAYYHSYRKGNVTGTYYDGFDNYIEIENDIYQRSDRYLKEILLNNKFIFNFGNVPVYIQTKIFQTFSERLHDKNFKLKDYKDALKQVDKLILKNDNSLTVASLPDKRFLADILNYYKDAKFIIPEIDFDDMHNDNYGYLKNGKPVIFDFSEFSDY